MKMSVLERMGSLSRDRHHFFYWESTSDDRKAIAEPRPEMCAGFGDRFEQLRLLAAATGDHQCASDQSQRVCAGGGIDFGSDRSHATASYADPDQSHPRDLHEGAF